MQLNPLTVSTINYDRRFLPWKWFADQQVNLQLQDVSQSLRSVQLESELTDGQNDVLERNKRSLFVFGIADVLKGVLGGLSGFLDTISGALSAVGSFLHISWFLNVFVGIINVVSTALKIIQTVLSLLPAAVLTGEIAFNVNYILRYLFSGNLFAVGVYVLNIVIAVSTFPW